jgi:2-oxoglutarate dehydrogenase E2 component (dihydrolipoamide succinyltransferase)
MDACDTGAGDTVKEDDVIAQIETDKVTIDIKYTG